MSKEVWSPEDYRTYKPKKKAKYRNEKVEVDGIEFDSKKEAKRYGELCVRIKAREIRELDLHLPIPLTVNGILICKYVADFKYIEEKDNRPVIEDVKSEITRRNPIYRLKKKLLRAVLGIEILEK